MSGSIYPKLSGGFNMNTASKHLNKGVTNPKNLPNYPPPQKPGQNKFRTCPNCQEKLPIDRRCGCESFEIIENYDIKPNNNNTKSVKSNDCDPNTICYDKHEEPNKKKVKKDDLCFDDHKDETNNQKENCDPNTMCFDDHENEKNNVKSKKDEQNNNNNIKIEKIDPYTTREYLLLQTQYREEQEKHQLSCQKIESFEIENKILQDEIINLKKQLEETNTKDLRISNLEQRVQNHKELSSVALLQVEELQKEMDEKNKKIEELKFQLNEIKNENKSKNDIYIQDINILTKDIYSSLNQKGESAFPYQENDISDVYPINTVDLSNESEGTTVEIDSFNNINTNNDKKDKQNIILLQSSNENSNNNNGSINELRKAFNVLQNKLNSKEKDVQNLKSNQFVITSTNVELKEENEQLKNDITTLNDKLNKVQKSLKLATVEFTNYKLQYNDELHLNSQEQIDNLQKANENLKNKIESLTIKESQLLSKFNEQLKDTQSKLTKANDELNSNMLELNKFRKKEYEDKHTFVCPMCKERCKNEYSMIIEKCGHKLCWRTKNDCIRAYAKNIYRQSKQPHCYECKNLKNKTTIIPELQLELVLSQQEMEEYHKLVCLQGHMNHHH